MSYPFLKVCNFMPTITKKHIYITSGKIVLLTESFFNYPYLSIFAAG